MAITAPPELVRPTYSIRRYTDQIYKIVKFKSDKIPLGPGPVENHQSYDEKLDSSLSRSRRVLLELALCNPWDWFVTLTLSQENGDRFDLSTWAKRLAQWLRDQRKKGVEVAYVLVPERHENGSWHAHGLFRLDSSQLVSFWDMKKIGVKVPWKLVKGGYYNWPTYQSKFGFCSFGRIRNPVACAFYVTKYLTKDSVRLVSDVGSHMYFCSKGLNRSTDYGDVYGHFEYLDSFLTHEYEFVSTGFTRVVDKCDWTFSADLFDIPPLDPLDLPEEEIEADQYMEFVQECINLNF